MTIPDELFRDLVKVADLVSTLECRYDKDKDGNCGRVACPLCGRFGLHRLAFETIKKVDQLPC
jgi:hypothetical protein